tara:strand:+ start:1595 stop:2014 length:420 start_codon:yes stop_codon:yes gene_type:complete
MDIELLEKALNNNENLSIINTNIQEIKTHKNDILQKLNLKRNDLKNYNKKLLDYKYVDNIKNLHYGSNIRWINLKNLNNISLNMVAILCDIKILENGIALTLKTFNNRFITLYLNENLIFQKLNSEEKIILKALSCLNK